MQTGTRPAAVAGLFYRSEKEALLKEIFGCFADKNIGPGITSPFNLADGTRALQQGKVECFVVPHAGYTYSGAVAAHSYSRTRMVSREDYIAIILGPNHYGIGSGIALSPSVAWETPLGAMRVDHEASNAIQGYSDLIDIDWLAHSKEHSIEVQVPFLQANAGNAPVSIVPISLMLQDKESMEDVANSINAFLETEKSSGRSFLILGSSDLTHYEPQQAATEKDMKLIRKIEALDVDAFYTILQRNDITACGYGAIAVAMIVAKKLGKKRGNLLKYATSGDVTGERDSVVGYCSVHFT